MKIEVTYDKILIFNEKNFVNKEIFYTKNSNYSNLEFLGVLSEEKNNFTNPLPLEKLYFAIKNEDEKWIKMSNEYLALDGTYNFRDIGGYFSNTQKRLKYGMIYRADQLNNLSERDIKLLENMRLASIVDYRSNGERKLYPNKNISTAKTYCLNPNSEVAEAAAKAMQDIQAKSTIDLLKNGEFNVKNYCNKNEYMYKEYEKFIFSPESQEAYKKFLELLLDEKNYPMVIHCRGGKDRTGFGAMLVMLILGISEKDIVKDYELTSYYRKERDKKQMDLYRQYTDDREILELLETMQKCNGEYLIYLLNIIKKEFGTIENYLFKIFNLNNEKIEKIRTILLEEI